ncbi:MAG: hypothetical protein RR668_06865 [Algoriella sp.]
MKNKAFLDILFENRNKEYGAYQLRQIADYDLMKSLFVGIGIVALITGGTIYANNRTINAETITGEHKVIVDVNSSCRKEKRNCCSSKRRTPDGEKSDTIRY